MQRGEITALVERGAVVVIDGMDGADPARAPGVVRPVPARRGDPTAAARSGAP